MRVQTDITGSNFVSEGVMLGLDKESATKHHGQ